MHFSNDLATSTFRQTTHKSSSTTFDARNDNNSNNSNLSITVSLHYTNSQHDGRVSQFIAEVAHLGSLSHRCRGYNNHFSNSKLTQPIIQFTQLLRLLTIFKDLCSGMNLEDSLNRRKETDPIRSDEDSNSVDYNVLEGKKTVMNNLSERNEMLPTKHDFTYDEEMDLPEEQIESYSWDSDECEF
uniref:Centrosomal protein of 19 kDa n=1 Tax=Schistosoma haematobium TaxID=6185 RepID=A0A094ZVR2_SCHHA